jgi:hypothetical protein
MFSQLPQEDSTIDGFEIAESGAFSFGFVVFYVFKPCFS